MPLSVETLNNECVRLSLSLEGGHLAPVDFHLGKNQWVCPYSMPPWHVDDFPEQPMLLRQLRGDFFCFPFGVTKGHTYPHGESANARWELIEKTADTLLCSMELTEPTGRIEKEIQLRNGHRALYQTHTIHGVKGTWNYGHHPILHIPEGTFCQIRTSPFDYASVYPGAFADPAAGECQALKSGTSFETLKDLTLKNEGRTSLETYPARDGNEDLVMICPSGESLAWTAVTFDDYVWVSLRNIADFPSTLFWMSNGGRQQAPWLGRHRGRIGIEDVCSYFHEGAEISRQNLLADAGIATSRTFHPDQPTPLRHIQFVHPIEAQSGLARLSSEADKQVQLQFEDGTQLNAAIDWKWLLQTKA